MYTKDSKLITSESSIKTLKDPPKTATATITSPEKGTGTSGFHIFRKVKLIWILLKQDTVSGNGISLAICKSASRFRVQTDKDNHASTPPLSFLQARMPFLPPNQKRQSTEGFTL